MHSMAAPSAPAEELDTYGKRLRWAMEVRSVRRNLDVAKAVGRSEARVGQILRKGSFDAEAHMLAARFLRVSPVWLALGEGEPPRRDEAPEAEVFSFGAADPVLKRAVQLLRETDPDTRVRCLEAITRTLDHAAAGARAKVSGE